MKTVIFALLLLAAATLVLPGCARGSSPEKEEGESHRGGSGARLVSGAVRASSPNYQLVTSMGEAPGGTGTSSSPAYRLEGGAAGAARSR